MSNQIVFDETSFPYKRGVDFSLVYHSSFDSTSLVSQSTAAVSTPLIQVFLVPSLTNSSQVHSTSQVTPSISYTILLDSQFFYSFHSSPLNDQIESLPLPLSQTGFNESLLIPSPPHIFSLTQLSSYHMITRSKARIFV